MKIPMSSLVVLFFVVGYTAVTAKESCDSSCRLQRAATYSSDIVPHLIQGTLPVPANVQWSPEDRFFWYFKLSAQGRVLYKVDIKNRSKTVAAKTKDVIAKIRQKYPDSAISESLLHDDLSYDPKTDTLVLHASSASYSYHVKSGRLDQIRSTPTDQHYAVSPDGQFMVFTKNHNLYIRTRDGNIRPLTHDGTKWHSFARYMARSNPDDRRPLQPAAPHVKWIGDGPLFYVERWDNRQVGDLWLIDSLSTPRPSLIRQKMAFPGEKAIPLPEIWIFNARTGDSIEIKNDGWAYLGNMDIGRGGIFPSLDGEKLYFTRMTRDYSIVELCVADLKTGAVSVLLRETRDENFTVRFPEFRELENAFIWKSDKDGYQHYYLFTKDGHPLNRITRGAFSVDHIIAVDEKAGKILFSAFGNAEKGNPLYSHIYSARLDGSKIRQLDNVEANHRTIPSHNHAYFIDQYSRPDLAPSMVLKDWDGKTVMTLETGTIAEAPGGKWQAPTLFRVLAADGKTPLYGVMWKPENFDPDKKYPLITHVYPGPGKEKVPVEFDPDHADAQLAQLGFIVVNVEQRGSSPTRGNAYLHYAREFGNMRDYPLADNKAAIEQLAKRYPFIDHSRVGIYGHSGGGFMTVAAMLAYPDFYKVGVSSSGNHDNNIYEMNSSEFYFGAPDKGLHSPFDGYHTNAEVASRLEGHLLLIHGDMDSDVSVAQTLRLVKALTDANKRFDTLILPGENHNYSPHVKDYVKARTWEYFLTYLYDLAPSGVNMNVSN